MNDETTRGGGFAPLDTSALVDLAALLVLLGVVAVGFGPVWGTAGYLLPALGGVGVGLGVAWIGAWRRLSAVTVTGLAVLGYLLLGGLLALPHTTVAGALPTLDTLRGLLLGAVEGWKEFITTAPPLSSFPDLAVVPFALMLVVSLAAGTIAWRARHAVWALAPVTAGFVGVILLGTLDEAWPVVQGGVIALVGLLWGGVRAMDARVGSHSIATESSSAAIRRLRWYRVRTGAAILGVAALTAAFVAPAVMPDQPRTVLRETIVPPLDLHRYVSPLVAFRQYAKERRTDELFTISNLPDDGRVRLATLDEYDGVVFDASGEGGDTGVYSRVGEDIATAATGEPLEVEVSVTGYDGVWVPEVGALTGITWTGPRAAAQDDSTYYNSATRTAVATAGLQPGDTYTLSTLVPEVPDEEELAQGTVLKADLPDVPDTAVPRGLPAKTAQFTGEEIDPATKLFLLRDALAASGVLSSGLEGEPPSRPGHSAERIDTLVQEEKMVGDDEQFAVALALMARQSGIPARVVMGFAPDEDSGYTPGEPWTVLGSDVRAWVEVPFEGHGWVPVEAIPEEKPQIQPEPQSEEVPKPPVLQDPEPPEEPDQAKAGSVEDDEEEEVENEAFDWGRLALIVLAAGIPLLLVVGPVVAILAYKARRRTRRRLAEEPAARFSGGWHEVVDVATDLGSTVPVSATRRESADLIAAAHQAPGTLAVAHRADATVFGAGASSAADAEGYWQDIDRLVGGMGAGVPRGRRLRAALSLRSIRARSRWSRSEEKR
ncbi:transglutaminaseTgpA domain-containing protein [Isoptericola halotolerans]|uniref:transglutaminase family protein n=1 Tax=Isoptericola halotolerans TaxID=300560 RepID=UPI00388EF001